MANSFFFFLCSQSNIGADVSWEQEFQAQELQLTPEASTSQPVQAERTKPQLAHDADELARTAGLLLDNVKNEENPKFQKSLFLGLMKQFRDREVIVDGDKIVENDGRTAVVDVKGKGRAVAQFTASTSYSMSRAAPITQQEGTAGQRGQQSTNQELRTEEEEDPNVAYFQRENEDFVEYWQARSVLPGAGSTDAMFWDKLQEDWEDFEATASGIKAVEHYQFQPSNPYLVGDSSRTRHHRVHTGQSFESEVGICLCVFFGTNHSIHSQSILELEAAVQRNMADSRAWYELGVKQQENEREHKALQALERAVTLDPTYLSAWLALAVSHANNSNRKGTLEAINSWVSQNTKYRIAVEKFNALCPPASQSALTERYSQVIQCLISLATSDTSGEVDADIQIALAILLNTNEEYSKAQDCFKTALAVRPDVSVTFPVDGGLGLTLP
jgi:peroxin-5